MDVGKWRWWWCFRRLVMKIYMKILLVEVSLFIVLYSNGAVRMTQDIVWYRHLLKITEDYIEDWFEDRYEDEVRRIRVLNEDVEFHYDVWRWSTVVLVQLSRVCSREQMQFVLRSTTDCILVRHQLDRLRRVSIHVEYNRLHEMFRSVWRADCLSMKCLFQMSLWCYPWSWESEEKIVASSLCMFHMFRVFECIWVWLRRVQLFQKLFVTFFKSCLGLFVASIRTFLPMSIYAGIRVFEFVPLRTKIIFEVCYSTTIVSLLGLRGSIIWHWKWEVSSVNILWDCIVSS